MVGTRAPLFERLKKGLEEGIEQARGERELRITEVVLPNPPPNYGVEEIRRIRARLNLSQPGFARLLHVSQKTVQSWEQGTRRPSQAAARLLQFVENPALLTDVQHAVGHH